MGKCSQAEAAVNVDAHCCAVGVGNSNPPAQAPVSKHATSSPWSAHRRRPGASQVVALRIALPEVKRVVFKHEKQHLRCSRLSYNQSNSSVFTSQVDGITPASKLQPLHLKSDNARWQVTRICVQDTTPLFMDAYLHSSFALGLFFKLFTYTGIIKTVKTSQHEEKKHLCMCDVTVKVTVNKDWLDSWS